MAHSTRLVNPRLGLYFGIYASLLASAVILALLLEQMGVADGLIRATMFAIPLLLYAGLGLAATTQDPLDFLIAGRRVPPFFAGLGIAVTALGGVGLVALTGAIFLMGADGFALLLGWLAGLVVMAVLLVPFLRKFGAVTLAGYLGARLESRLLRIIAAALLAVPALLVLIAEIRLTGEIASWLSGQPEQLMVIGLVGVTSVSIAAGGMRSLTWSSAAKGIAMLVALIVPVTIVSLLISNLPLPQLTSGNMSRNIFRTELARGVPVVLAGAWVFDVPGAELEPMGRRFLQMFSSIGASAFSATVFVIMAGIASSPALLARAGTTSGVYAARQSMAWAVLILAFTLLTMVAAAVFLRGYVTDLVVGMPADRLPTWFQELQRMGQASVAAKGSAVVATQGISVQRDAVLFALPRAAGLPTALVYLALAGALAAGMAAIAGQLLTLGTSLAEDVLLGVNAEAVESQPHVLAGRIGVAAMATAALVISFVPADPLQLVLWSLAITAATSFPVLVLSILWKRLNAWGALCGMVTGFAVTVGLIMLERVGLSGLSGPVPAIIGMPAATLAAVMVSRITPAASRHALELLRDMRVPGGETLTDRQTRLARFKRSR